MLLIVLGVLVELYRPIRTYLTVKNEDPVVNVEFGSLAVWKCGVLRTERPFSATVVSSDFAVEGHIQVFFHPIHQVTHCCNDHIIA